MSRCFRNVGVASIVSLLIGAGAAADPVTTGSIVLVDTIGSMSLDTKFTSGWGGWPVFGIHSYGGKYGGPQFTLTRPMVLTNVGAFISNCETLVAGVPDCNVALPIMVQIRPALASQEDAPDPSRVLATYPLSNDNDPFTVSFESASFRLPLEAGIYYALFAPPDDEGGAILDYAQEPLFRAGSAIFGTFEPVTGTSSVSRMERGAVLVTAAPVPEPSTIVLVVAGATMAAARRVRQRRAR